MRAGCTGATLYVVCFRGAKGSVFAVQTCCAGQSCCSLQSSHVLCVLFRHSIKGSHQGILLDQPMLMIMGRGRGEGWRCDF